MTQVGEGAKVQEIPNLEESHLSITRSTPISRTPKALAIECRGLASPVDTISPSCHCHPPPLLNISSLIPPDDDCSVGRAELVFGGTVSPAPGRRCVPGQRGRHTPPGCRLPAVERPHPHAHRHRRLFGHPAGPDSAKRETPTAPTKLRGRPAFKFKMSSTSPLIGPRSVVTSRGSPRAVRRRGEGARRKRREGVSIGLGKAGEPQGLRLEIPKRERGPLINRLLIRSHGTPASSLPLSSESCQSAERKNYNL